MLQHVAACCSSLIVAADSSVLQCVAIWCSVLLKLVGRVVQCVAVCCSKLTCGAGRCSVLLNTDGSEV